ncbi:hypothetical protein [Streptomyces mobaraensis]|uniref:Uncharacterized protein n=1 Tax=Streptomyces mobaraensis TaxID=35621 RepID=A0A5N5W1C9_STRMB|nr:hypothetical protein [Streptomyces mobaraensis]KAB7835581.1 hypothetical protein FRZ00_27255 [Streptomyces mobaraensis]
MTDDAVLWSRLVALLPEAEAEGVEECRAVGEQEAGLGLLVSGLLDHQVPISEMVRARLSVLAEIWGEREALTPQILQCRGDGALSSVELIEGDGSAVPEATGWAGQDLAGLVLVPWISCPGRGRVLMRAHTQEYWGDLSYLARHYVISEPDRGVLRVFPADSADAAFTSLCSSWSSPS